MTVPIVSASTNPYPGLRPFREDEEGVFFGREKQVDAMVDKLAESHFLAVVGTSGSGKSSLVNCGLRPALHRGLMARAGTTWRMAQFRPGNNPLRAMAVALARDGVLYKNFDAGDFTLAEIIETSLRMSKLGLLDICEQAQLGTGTNLLVVVDQFEELFRYRKLGASPTGTDYGVSEDATAFVNLLLEVREHANCPIHVVLTMRSDFLGDCAQFLGLPEAINKGQYLVPRLTRDERRAAIDGPAGVGGSSIDPVLLMRLVNDVGDNPDQLSILQHALNRTWARWERDSGGKGPLELRHYEAIGSMAHALNQHAEEAFAELGTEREKTICELIFKALTDTGTDARGIRRPTELGPLCNLAEATQSEVAEVIDVFREPSRSFLMPPAGEPLQATTVIDISHESLMRVWERLKGWSDDEARSARIYRRLADTADLHAAGKASLLRDAELQFALDWHDRNRPNETWAMQYRLALEPVTQFLEESKAARDREIVAERRRAKRRRWTAVGLMMVLAGAAGSFSYLWYTAENALTDAKRQRGVAEKALTEAEREKVVAETALAEAERQKGLAETARSQRLLALASATQSADLALLQSVAADEFKSTPEAQEALLNKVKNAPQGFLWLRPHQSSTDDLVVAVSHDGRRLVSGSTDGSVVLWDVATRKPVGGPLLPAHGIKVTGLAFTRDDRWLAAGLGDGQVILWDLHVPKPAGEPLPGTGGVANVVVAFSSDGQRLVSGSSDGVMLWDMTSRSKLLDERLLVPDINDATAIAFSPDGRLLAVGGRDGRLIFWDLAERKPRTEPMRAGYAPITTLAFHPKGELLALGNSAGRVIWWDIATQQDVTPGRQSGAQHSSDVLSTAFSPDGSVLASSSKDGSVILWDVDGREARGEPLRSGAGARSVAFGDDQLLAAAAGDGLGVVLWDVSGRNPLGMTLTGHRGQVGSVAFSPDGKLLASGGREDKAVILWGVAGRKPLGEPLLGHKGPVVSAAFSPDGKTLASGSNKAIILWDVASRTPLGEPLIEQDGAVVAIAFSPDGKILASASNDQTIFLWDLVSRKPLGDPQKLDRDRATSLAISPDGRLVAIATQKGVFLWDVAVRKSLGEPLTGHRRAVTRVAFSPDGKVLASGSDDKTVIFWDVASRKPLGRPLPQSGPVFSVAFSPEGRLLAVGTPNAITLWDVAARKIVGEPLEAAVNVVAFNSDSRLVASGRRDGNLTIWDVNEEDWRRRACAIANRNFAPTEWRQIYGNDPYAKTCPNSLIHPGWIDAARILAKGGRRVEAETMLAMVNRIEPDLHLDPKSELDTFTIVGAVARLFSTKDPKTFAASETNLELATTAYDNIQDPRARELVLEEVKAKFGKYFWNDLCWQAAWRQHAKAIMFACEYAVSMDLTDGAVRDSRGVARVLTGEFAGAIEDLQAYVEWINRKGGDATSIDQVRKAQRERWIAALKSGSNPLTPEELKTLEDQ